MGRTFLLGGAIVLAAVVTAWSGDARAQPDAARETEARALFASGRQAADAGLWSEAVDRFSRSYEAFPTASALYNLAVALRALGQHIEARDALARLLSEHQGELSEAQEGDARDLLAAEGVRTARIALEGLPRDSLEVAIDGGARDDTGERPLVLEVNPGEHRLRVAGEGYEPYEWEGALLEGQRLRIDVALAPSLAEAAPSDVEDSASVLSSPWFWVITGAIVLGAAAAAIVVLGQPEQIEPLSDRRYTL